MPDGQRPEPPEFEEGADRPAPPDDHAGGMSFNSQDLLGLLQVVLQIALVNVLVAGGRWLISWLQRWRRAPANPA